MALWSPLRVSNDEANLEGRNEGGSLGSKGEDSAGGAVATSTEPSDQMASYLNLVRCVWEWTFQLLGPCWPHAELGNTASHARLYQGSGGGRTHSFT